MIAAKRKLCFFFCRLLWQAAGCVEQWHTPAGLGHGWYSPRHQQQSVALLNQSHQGKVLLSSIKAIKVWLHILLPGFPSKHVAALLRLFGSTSDLTVAFHCWHFYLLHAVQCFKHLCHQAEVSASASRVFARAGSLGACSFCIWLILLLGLHQHDSAYSVCI